MPNTVDSTEDPPPPGQTHEQQAALPDGHRRELAAQERWLRGELHAHETGLGPSAGPPILSLREAERRHLVAALEHTGGKIYGHDGAARLLDLKPTTLQSKLKKHGINRLAPAGEGKPAEGSDAPSDPAPARGTHDGARSLASAQPRAAPVSLPAE